jgi:hypothetical protein
MIIKKCQKEMKIDYDNTTSTKTQRKPRLLPSNSSVLALKNDNTAFLE